MDISTPEGLGPEKAGGADGATLACHSACHSKDVDVRAALALGACEHSSSAASISRDSQCWKHPSPQVSPAPGGTGSLYSW